MIGLFGFLLATLALAAGILRLVYPPIWRDLYTLYVNLSVIKKVKKAYATRELIIDQFERQALLRPTHPLIIFKDQSFTYSDVSRQANRVAHVLLELGVAPGDTISIVMSNEPAFLWIYLGVQKIGARIALVNHHLVGDGLRHSIVACAPKLVIIGTGFRDSIPDRVSQLSPRLTLPVYVYHQDSSVDLPSFSERMERVTDESVPESLRLNVKLSDPCAFIFTSGTTGLPKPAIISHKKAVLCSHCFSPVGFSETEVMYLTLPLYHSSALNLAFLNVINVGATLVLREKFSVSEFWSDCVKYNVTSFQYIGEMLRYLVNSPQKLEETQHKVWAAIGNGLRQDIWVKFKSRFKMDNIFEFYGSTELPASVTNLFNVPGSVGRLSPLLSKLTNLILVEVDAVTGLPYRNSKGRCDLIKPGSSGVLLAKLSEKVTFEGYLGPPSDTNNRIIQEVLEPGDFYVNTNDVFSLDPDYNLFFKERIGDNFRWVGENISSAEVSNAMNTATFVQDTNVYGVEVPGCEGKAGMAAVNLKEGEHLDEDKIQELGRLCNELLPDYARPRFLRFQRQMSLTSTFKQQKTELSHEGFDPHRVTEPMFYLDKSCGKFRPLNDTAFNQIMDGRVAL